MAEKGRPAHKVTKEYQDTAKRLSALGVTHEDIALRLKISADTLTKYYQIELDEGRIDANSAIAGTLFQQAKNGNTAAAIFWLKTRAKWKEVSSHEITGKDGGPIEERYSLIEKFAARRAKENNE
jgi:Asp-tRNA(Asn)/Glu-tRNA(Gln) amidotransferase A subunit family amidase